LKGSEEGVGGGKKQGRSGGSSSIEWLGDFRFSKWRDFCFAKKPPYLRSKRAT